MNIYIDVEIPSRELDGKLLLATLAASKGHKVIVSNLSEILLGLKKRILAPGIFHTTSLVPGTEKIFRHQVIIDNGSKITSMDEEGGLVDHGYDKFARIRYSNQTLEQSSATFGWGPEDTDTLKRIYPTQSNKIYNTGSPRADLWKSNFSEYWGIPKNAPDRPFLLVSSNTHSVSSIRPFYQNIKHLKRLGLFQSDPELFSNQFKIAAEDSLKTYKFIEAIKYLASNNNGFDVVLRPHPIENIEAWKVFLGDIPNVYIIKKDSITPWVNNAFAVMHNNCTTAIEATFSNKPVVTYIPFKQKYGREIPNELGHRVESLEELSQTVNALFDNMKSDNQKNMDKKIPEIVSKKININEDDLAAEKIIKVWESLDDKSLSKTIYWVKFYWLLKIIDFRRLSGKLKRKLFPSRFGSYKENHKFPLLKKHDICGRVKRLQHVLGIEEKIECKLLSDRTILVKKS